MATTLRGQVDHLLQHWRGRLPCESLRLTDHSCGRRPGAAVVDDRFTFELQYVGTTLTWQLLLSGHQPELPPDFLFGTGPDAAFAPPADALPALSLWDVARDDALLDIFTQLVRCYGAYQESLVQRHCSPLIAYEFGQNRGAGVAVTTLGSTGNNVAANAGPVVFCVTYTALAELLPFCALRRVSAAPNGDWQTGPAEAGPERFFVPRFTMATFLRGTAGSRGATDTNLGSLRPQ